MEYKVKILQVGDFRFDYYDESLFRAFSSDNRVIIEKFSWSGYFSNYSYANVFAQISCTIANRYKASGIVRRINNDLLNEVEKNSYDVIFLWRAVHLYPSTIKKLKQKAVVIGYNNDQTFSNHHPWWLFFLLKRSIRYYDHYFVYRPADIQPVNELGVSSSVFMPTFDKTRIFPNPARKQEYDVVFIGHYEDDGRDELLLKLAKSGYKVRLNGQRWDQSKYHDELFSLFGDIKPVYDDYNAALNSAKVCLSFLSKLNSDTYTRRTLEIPATKTVMLAEYTDDQARMFEPDKEAVYFTNHEEALSKLTFLLENHEIREDIALAGYNKVMNGAYQLADRVDDILNIARKMS